MRIIDESTPLEEHGVRASWVMKPGCEPEQSAYDLPAEHVVRVSVGGEPTMSLTCTPRHIVELVVGRLFTENVISGVDEIEEVRLCAGETQVLVELFPSADVPANAGAVVEDVGTCYVERRSVSSLIRRDENLPQLDPISWTPEDVFTLARVFKGDAPMHKKTYGAHSCYLARGSEVLYCCEDLGRHNAFDKVIGCALMDGVDLRECTVFTSGRVPTDMALKAVRARIPIMVSKAVPTDLAVRMAQEHKLTLICSAHPDSFVVVNDPR